MLRSMPLCTSQSLEAQNADNMRTKLIIQKEVQQEFSSPQLQMVTQGFQEVYLCKQILNTASFVHFKLYPVTLNSVSNCIGIAGILSTLSVYLELVATYSGILSHWTSKQTGIHYGDPVKNLPSLFSSEVRFVVKFSVPINIYNRLSTFFSNHISQFYMLLVFFKVISHLQKQVRKIPCIQRITCQLENSISDHNRRFLNY